jgi:tetratricopeptide (TPR) repeat protein
METQFPVVYLSILLALLSVTAWIIFRQILKTRKVETSFSRLQNKLKNGKGTAEEYYELGTIYLDKKLFVQSVNLFQKALKEIEGEVNENIALIYNGLGFSYFAQEQYDIAIRQYKEALKLWPEYVTALNNLGHAYERKKLTAQALQTYEEALKYEPNNQTAKRRAESLRKRLVTT